MQKHKIFVFNNGGSDQWYTALAIAEDGRCLASHICSSPSWMEHDMGFSSDWHHKEYDAHYGAGNWELEWVDNPKSHAGLMAAYELNQKMQPADTTATDPTPTVPE